MPVRVLESIIQQEEKTNRKGVCVYNRGDNLKKSLIDADKVRAYVEA
jgi:hypothetical protein